MRESEGGEKRREEEGEGGKKGKENQKRNEMIFF